MLLEPTFASTGPHSADDFADYFTGKVEGIRATTAGAPPLTIQTRSVSTLNGFDGRTLEEVTRVIQKAPRKQCDIDPVLTCLVEKFVDQLGQTIKAMIGLSFSQGYFPASHKHAIVRPRVNKLSLDPLDIKSYRHISNLSFISKLTERLFIERFNNHARTHHLLPAKTIGIQAISFNRDRYHHSA